MRAAHFKYHRRAEERTCSRENVEHAAFKRLLVERLTHHGKFTARFRCTCCGNAQSRTYRLSPTAVVREEVAIPPFRADAAVLEDGVVRVAVEAYWTHAVSAEKGTTLASKWLEVDAFPDGLADDKPPELRVLDSNFFSGKPCAHCQALQDSRDEQEQREREVHEVRLHAHVEAERRREGEERQRETERHALMLAARARLAAGTGTGSISFHSSQLIELAPTVSSLSYSTVQSFMYETSKRTVLASTEQNGKFLLHLVVYCNQEFPGHADETQRYGLVVSLEHEDAQIQLYQSVQQTVVTDVRVRTRVRV